MILGTNPVTFEGVSKYAETVIAPRTERTNKKVSFSIFIKYVSDYIIGNERKSEILRYTYRSSRIRSGVSIPDINQQASTMTKIRINTKSRHNRKE